ncbi:MAG: shikimate dehydrogenase [Pelagibacterales bacterium]|nr:shikimate dehydrogenase [Pelagibacterales bacterium]
MIISSKAIKAAVIGDPISHSLSPKIHNSWIEQKNIDGVYLALKIAKSDLNLCVDSLVKMNFSGFNVTIPHKEEIYKICDFKSKTAELTKAVNTVIITEDKKLFGHNSDSEGFLNNLYNSQKSFNCKNKTAFVIGAGGAARAIIYSLLKSEIKEIYITNRSENRALELISDFKDFAAEKNCNLYFLDSKNFEENLDKCHILINSTSLGMVGQEQLKIDLKTLPKSAIVYDIVYKPLITELLYNAQKQGNQIVTGIGMLVYQAAVGFEAWFKSKPQVDDNFIQQTLSWANK